MDEDPRLYGWIEMLTTEGTWGAWRKVQQYLKLPNPTLFYLLFGIGDGSLGWNPVASGRGIPSDLSDVSFRSQRLFSGASFGQTWISLAEIEQARQQCSAQWDDYIHCYEGWRPWKSDEIVFTSPPLRLKTPPDLSQEQQILLDLGIPVVRTRMQKYIREPLEADLLFGYSREWSMLLKDLRDQRAVYKDIRLVVAFQEFA